MRVELNSNKTPKEVTIDASYLYAKYTFDGVQLHIMQTHADNIYLDMLSYGKRDKNLLQSGHFGINGGFFNPEYLPLSLAINNGVNLPTSYSNSMGKNGKASDGSPYKSGALIYDFNKIMRTVRIGNRDEMKATMDNCRWAQGGMSMSLGNKNWHSIAKNEILPKIDAATTKTGMVGDSNNNVYLIVTDSGCTAGQFRAAIQSRLKIADSNYPSSVYYGIFLDGGGSSQLRCVEKTVDGDKRELVQIVRLKNRP